MSNELQPPAPLWLLSLPSRDSDDVEEEDLADEDGTANDGFEATPALRPAEPDAEALAALINNHEKPERCVAYASAPPYDCDGHVQASD